MKKSKIIIVALLPLLAGCSNAHSFISLKKNEALYVDGIRVRNTKTTNESTVLFTYSVDPIYSLKRSVIGSESDEVVLYDGFYYYFEETHTKTSQLNLGQCKEYTEVTYSYMPYSNADTSVAVKTTTTHEVKYDFKGGWIKINNLDIQYDLNEFFEDRDEMKSCSSKLDKLLARYLSGELYANYFSKKTVSESVSTFTSALYYIEKVNK